MDTTKAAKYCFKPLSTQLLAMFVCENQWERGVL